MFPLKREHSGRQVMNSRKIPECGSHQRVAQGLFRVVVEPVLSRGRGGLGEYSEGSKGRRFLGSQLYYHKLQLESPLGGGTGHMARGTQQGVRLPLLLSSLQERFPFFSLTVVPAMRLLGFGELLQTNTSLFVLRVA